MVAVLCCALSTVAFIGFLAPVLAELDAQGGLDEVLGELMTTLNAQLAVRVLTVTTISMNSRIFWHESPRCFEIAIDWD